MLENYFHYCSFDGASRFMARVRSSRHSAFSRYKRTHSKTWRKFRRTQKKRKMFVKRVKRIISKNTDPVQIWAFSPDSTTGPIA